MPRSPWTGLVAIAALLVCLHVHTPGPPLTALVQMRPPRGSVPQQKYRRVCRCAEHADSAEKAPLTAAWHIPEEAEPPFAEWIEDEVLALPVGDPAMAFFLGLGCRGLADRGGGLSHTNVGGFHSDDLTGADDPVIRRFMGLLHTPLAAFLRRRYGKLAPSGIHDSAGLSVSAIAHNLWANVNKPGNYNRRHNHGRATRSLCASGVYYPMAAGEPSLEAFGSPTSASKLLFFPEGRKPFEVQPLAGLLLLFRTDLMHETEPVPEGEPPRASLAFNLRSRWLDTDLSRAAIAGDAVQVQRLLAEGADVDAADGLQGMRPSHHAAEAGQLEALQALAAGGANVDALSLEGWSPLGLAFDRKHMPVVEYLAGSLEEAGARLKDVGYPDAYADPAEA